MVRPFTFSTEVGSWGYPMCWIRKSTSHAREISWSHRTSSKSLMRDEYSKMRFFNLKTDSRFGLSGPDLPHIPTLVPIGKNFGHFWPPSRKSDFEGGESRDCFPNFWPWVHDKWSEVDRRLPRGARAILKIFDFFRIVALISNSEVGCGQMRYPWTQNSFLNILWNFQSNRLKTVELRVTIRPFWAKIGHFE